MKLIKIISTLLFLLITQISKAQYLDLKGLVANITLAEYVENKETKSYYVSQTYSISFTDEILSHIIIKDKTVDNAQMYKVGMVEKFLDGDNTIIKFDALSGISGNTFKYKISINKEGKLNSMIVTEKDDTVTTYYGGISNLKTFKQ